MSKTILLASAMALLAVPALASSTTTVTTTASAPVNNPGLNSDVTSTIAIQDRNLFDVDNNGVVTRNEYSARMPQIDKNGNGRIEAMERANFVQSMPGNINTRGSAAAQAQADAGGRPTANAATSSTVDSRAANASAEPALNNRSGVITTTKTTALPLLSTHTNAQIRADAMARPAADVNAAYNGGGVQTHSTTVTTSGGQSSTTINSNLNAVAPAARVNGSADFGLNR